MRGRLRRSADPRPPADACQQRGFSFMELLIVMGAMAVLLGLAVGYIRNIGQATYVAQARAMLQETAYRCINASIGDRRAIFTLREVQDLDGGRMLRIGAAVARPVLTHQFETLDFASGARRPEVHGGVEVARGEGRVGNAARFDGSGHLSFPAQSAFAMTEGLELDVWLRPESGSRQMTVVEGVGSYGVYLNRAGESNAYDVQLRLKLRRAADGPRAPGLDRTFETRGGPLPADGRWSRVQVRYDGLEVSIRVNGLEAYEAESRKRRPGGALGPEELEDVQRIVVPAEGVVPLLVSAGAAPYRGRMDSLRLLGVFRGEDLERDLPGAIEVTEPALPLRIVFRNGALDPDVHDVDQVIRVRDKANPEDPPLRLRIGMYGTVDASYDTDTPTAETTAGGAR